MVSCLKIWAISTQHIGQNRQLNLSYGLYTKLQILFYHLRINFKSISSKFYKAMKDLGQSYTSKVNHRKCPFFIDQST